jgi:hypothetical protein
MRFTLQNIQRQNIAPTLVEQVREEEDHEDLARVCAEVETTVRNESKDRDLGKHAGIAALYLVIDRLASPEYSNTDIEGKDHG